MQRRRNVGQTAGRKRKSQQTGQNTDQGKQLQEVEQHPFADPTEGGSIADSANSPGHRQENHGTGNGSQHIEECFVERTQKLIQHGCPACFRQQKSGETHNDRGSGSEGQTQQGFAFLLFQLKNDLVFSVFVAVQGRKSHVGQQTPAVSAILLRILLQRIAGLAFQLQLQIGPPQTFVQSDSAGRFGREDALSAQQDLFQNQPDSQQVLRLCVQLR